MKENGKTISKAARIDWIDTAKGIGILLVMLGHCYLDGRFTFWFCSFHMALFFILSGYTFSAKGEYPSFLFKKVRTLLIPYAFFAIITMLCNGILEVTHGNAYDVFGILKLYLIQCRYTPLWFITCLFLAEQLMYLATAISRKISWHCFWLISGIGELLLFYLYKSLVKIDLPWNADLALLAAAFMSFGKWFREANALIGITTGMRRMLFVATGVVSVLAAWWNCFYFGRVDWFSNSFGNPGLFLLAAVAGVLATIFVSININLPALTALGRNSLLFFGLHRVVIDLVFVIYNKIGLEIVPGSWLSLMYAIISVIISVGVLTPVNWFVLKLLPWCMGKKRMSRLNEVVEHDKRYRSNL